MAVRRTTGVFPGGGTVVLQGLPWRQSLWGQKQSAANTIDVAFESGFTMKSLPPGYVFNRYVAPGVDQGLQGAITLTGTPGEPYDVEETYK